MSRLKDLMMDDFDDEPEYYFEEDTDYEDKLFDYLIDSTDFLTEKKLVSESNSNKYKDFLIKEKQNFSELYKITTKVVGVTYPNDDGSSRQTIISKLTVGQELFAKEFNYKDAPAISINNISGESLGFLSKELAREIETKFGNKKMSSLLKK